MRSTYSRSKIAEYATPMLFAALLLLAWEGSVLFLDVPLYIAPAPSMIADQFGAKFFSNKCDIGFYLGMFTGDNTLEDFSDRCRGIFDSTLITGTETLAGFAVALSIGIPLSFLVAFSSFLRRTLYPLAVTMEMVPKLVFAPIFVTWFGFGFTPKVLIVFLVCFFPILLNGILAFTSLSVELTRFALSTGAGPLRTFFKVRLPAALPQVFVGIKGAAVNATVGATISEWIGGDAGLGYSIQIASGDLQMDLAFAIIIMLAMLGLVLFWCVILTERALIPWHVSQRHVHSPE